jgi:hypothetical protein
MKTRKNQLVLYDALALPCRCASLSGLLLGLLLKQGIYLDLFQDH